jgi:hypothetical protein
VLYIPAKEAQAYSCLARERAWAARAGLLPLMATAVDARAAAAAARASEPAVLLWVMVCTVLCSVIRQHVQQRSSVMLSVLLRLMPLGPSRNLQIRACRDDTALNLSHAASPVP